MRLRMFTICAFLIFAVTVDSSAQANRPSNFFVKNGNQIFEGDPKVDDLENRSPAYEFPKSVTQTFEHPFADGADLFMGKAGTQTMIALLKSGVPAQSFTLDHYSISTAADGSTVFRTTSDFGTDWYIISSDGQFDHLQVQAGRGYKIVRYSDPERDATIGPGPIDTNKLTISANGDFQVQDNLGNRTLLGKSDFQKKVDKSPAAELKDFHLTWNLPFTPANEATAAAAVTTRRRGAPPPRGLN